MSQLTPAGYDWIRDNAFRVAEGAPLQERFGQIALARHYVTEGQLAECLHEQRSLRDAGKPALLGEVLVRRGHLSPIQILELLELQDQGLLCCAKCNRLYDVSGHPAGVRVRCLGCGDELEGPADLPVKPPSSDDATGQRLGKYVLKREIARGGMGIVFEAEDPGLGRRVALKILRYGETDPDVVSRLHREAAIAAQLTHPNIVGIHEVGMVRNSIGEPTHFIAMDYVEGPTLAEILRKGKTKLPDLLRMLEEVARATAYAHSKGVIHRDLKPQNVLVETTGRVMLTDFGLARAERFKTQLTRSDAVIGTPQYMAPEQAEGRTREVGPRTDVYALGVMLYEILAGRAPFVAETPAKLFEQIVKDEPTRPGRLKRGTPREIEVVCLKAMEKRPEHRYATASEFAEDLRRFREGEPIQARPASAWRRAIRKAVRHRVVAALATALFLVTVAGGTWAVVSRAKQQRRLAAEQDLRRRREEALRGLSVQWSKIIERNRDLRQRRMAPDQAWRELKAAVGGVDGYIRHWPEEPQGYYIRAKGRFYLGDLEGSEQDAQAAVTKRPDFRPGWSLLGLLEFEKVQIRFYSPVFDIEDLRSEVESGLASAMAATSRGLEAGREAEQSESWGLGWTREDQVMAKILRAESIRLLDKRPDEGRRLVEEGWEEYRAEEFANCLGVWSPPEAEVGFQTQAIALAPGYAKAFLDRGRAKQDLGDWEGAVSDCDKALELNGGLSAAYSDRGAAKNKLKDYAGAVADFDRALELRPNDAIVHLNRGVAWEKRGDSDRALADFGRAIELRPDFGSAFVNRGATRLRKRDYAGAIADYDRAVELGKGKAEVFHDLGLAKAESGDPLGAIADFGRAIELKHDYPLAHSNRGGARFAQGDFAGAAADFQEALRLAPPDWPWRAGVERRLKRAREKLRNP